MGQLKPWLAKKDTDKFVEIMGVKIYLKALKYGKSREALSLALKVNTTTGTASMDSGLLATLRALYQVKSWELTDENDEPLPITLATLDELDDDFVSLMIQAINELGGQEVTPAEKKE